MTTNQTIGGVPRKLLENCANYTEGSASYEVLLWHKELRALLDAPAKPVEGLEADNVKLAADRAALSTELESLRVSYKSVLAQLEAAQPQGEPVAILSGPDDSVCWTQDNTPKELRKQVVLIEHADFLRLQDLASGAAEALYQTRWCSLGQWEEWKTVSREKYERSDGQLFERRIVYAEQPAPVAVVLPELDESAIDDLAGSSCQEALAFGVHQDVFARLARTVHKRTLDEVTRLNTK